VLNFAIIFHIAGIFFLQYLIFTIQSFSQDQIVAD